LLTQFEQRNGVDFTLHHIGCPGETAQSVLVVGGDGHCDLPRPAQLTKALTFLQENESLAGLVTLDIGFNDLRPCYAGDVRNAACVARGLAFVTNDLPHILSQLKAAAGPKVVFVGMQYADPFLAFYVLSPTGQTVAEESRVDFNDLNAILAREYTAAGFAVADVPDLVDANDASPEVVPNVGTIPVNVAEECLTTWMCEPPPFGPDDHANNAGYMLAAEAIAKVLPAPWTDYPVK
jgi:lysophospholipase L1-like esterase